ncbi:MAG: aminoglycoside 6-adenylyltransferase, partial [Verrucomicrobiota bacterium]|nr:aminoglycoside 6-adenylyltransferase [Verrucomicrobiota bacterium]
MTALMPKATHKESAGKKPSEQEFQRVINEFWFEVHHVAKYLKREDLWSVKFRSGSIYDNFLLKMIEWNEQAKRNWESQLPPLGKRMRSWVDADTWKALHQIFAHFDSSDSRRGLLHLIELFRKIATDTAKRLGYTQRDSKFGFWLRRHSNLSIRAQGPLLQIGNPSRAGLRPDGNLGRRLCQ